MCTRRAVCSPLKLEMSSSDNMARPWWLAHTNIYMELAHTRVIMTWSDRVTDLKDNESLHPRSTAANETNDCKPWPGVKSFFSLFFSSLRETLSLIFRWHWIREGLRHAKSYPNLRCRDWRHFILSDDDYSFTHVLFLFCAIKIEMIEEITSRMNKNEARAKWIKFWTL